jgi:hypothetical protein
MRKRSGAGGDGDGLVAAQDQTRTGKGHRAQRCHAIDGQTDVHRPVGAGFTVFARAVDRIDNPHAGQGQPRRVVCSMTALSLPTE